MLDYIYIILSFALARYFLAIRKYKSLGYSICFWSSLISIVYWNFIYDLTESIVIFPLAAILIFGMWYNVIGETEFKEYLYYKYKPIDRSFFLDIYSPIKNIDPPIKNKRKNQVVVGFALEDKAVRARAEKKLKEKNLDMIIANTSAAIGADKSTVQIKIAGREWLKLSQASKATIAKRIVSLVGSN